MKLYREATPLEINSNDAFYGGSIGFGFFVPIEITEEDISDIIYHEFKHGISGAFTVSADRSAATILSELKGE